MANNALSQSQLSPQNLILCYQRFCFWIYC